MTEQKTEQKTDEQRHIDAQAMQRLQMERLRDEFAMAAMREILAHSETRHITDFSISAFEDVAVGSYQMADAMLAARTQEAK